MEAQSRYRILLYYKYVKIDEHELYADRHLKFCKALGLKGRILVAAEGLNGTVCGSPEQANAYMEALKADPRFADMIFKIDDVDEPAFRKMFVRTKEEIVTLGLENDLDPNEITGKHLTPKEFMDAIEKEDVLILDVRNDYEYDLGHFRNAVRPPVKAFKEFPQWVKDNLEEYKDKKILAYCTGGVRCEKFSGFLKREGFHDVNQLFGGIVSYAKDPEVQGRYFDGKCYVFDERISVPVNSAEEYKPVSTCKHCDQPCDRYINCAIEECNLQFFCCEECEKEHYRTCSEECKEKELKKEKVS